MIVRWAVRGCNLFPLADLPEYFKRGNKLSNNKKRWVCFGVQVDFKLLSERGQGGRGTNLMWKSIPQSGSIKSKTITKVFERFMNRRVELWNDKEIATTLTAPGTIRTAVGRKIWSKIPVCLIQFWLHCFGCTVIYID